MSAVKRSGGLDAGGVARPIRWGHVSGCPCQTGQGQDRGGVGGIANSTRCEASPPLSLIVCASPVHPFSRILGPPMITSWWGQEAHASAFNAIRRTTPSRSATAVARAGSSAAGSRVRGHHPPSTTSSAVDEGENASRTPEYVAATPGHGMPRR
jgi:hypothetical protein